MENHPNAHALHKALIELGLYQDEYILYNYDGFLLFSLLDPQGRVSDDVIVAAVKLSWRYCR